MRSRFRRVNSWKRGKGHGPLCWTTSMGIVDSIAIAYIVVSSLHELHRFRPIRSNASEMRCKHAVQETELGLRPDFRNRASYVKLRAFVSNTSDIGTSSASSVPGASSPGSSPRIASRNFVTGCLTNGVTKACSPSLPEWGFAFLTWYSFHVFNARETRGAKRREEFRVRKR